MKKILLLLTVFALFEAHAQTNRIDDLVITNKFGDVFRHLTLNRATPEGLLLDHKSGLLKLKWAELPSWCEDRYLTNGLETAQKEIEAGQSIRAFFARTEKIQQQEASEKARLETQWRAERGRSQDQVAMAGTWMIKGRVIQRAKDGLLVSSVGGDTTTYEAVHDSIVDPNHTHRSVRTAGTRIYDGICLLVGYTGEAGIVDGDQVCVQSSYEGQYSYTTVQNAGATVRKFKSLY